jgi:hypothetical protein
MADNQTTDPEQPAENPSENASSRVEGEETIPQHDSSPPPEQERTDQPQQGPKWNLIFTKTKNPQVRANYISLGAGIVQVAILFATAIICYQTKRNVDLTERNIDSSSAVNRAFLDRATKSADAASAAANALIEWEHTGETNYQLAKEALTAQIDEFQTENRPYVLVKELITSKIDKMFIQQITIRFQNYGKVPAYIYSEICDGKVKNTVGVFTDFIYSPRILIEVNKVLTPGETTDIEIAVPHTQEEIQPIYNGTKAVYIYGELYFRDIVKHTIEKSIFCYRILPSGYYIPNRIHNDIVDLSDSAANVFLKEHPVAERPINLVPNK